MTTRLYLKESVRVGHKQYWDRAIYRKPFPNEDIAKRALERAQRPDNFPYLIDEHNRIVAAGKKGEDYAREE